MDRVAAVENEIRELHEKISQLQDEIRVVERRLQDASKHEPVFE